MHMRCIMDNSEIYEISELFKAFADSTRIKILLSLFDGERSVGEIVNEVGATQTAVSHQLRALKGTHLVKGRREGKNIFYSLDDEHVKIIINSAIEHVEE